MIVGNDQEGDDTVVVAHVCGTTPSLIYFFLYMIR